MSGDYEDTDISLLKKELEATMAKNKFLEKESKELKQEVLRLKSLVSSLKSLNNERKSLLWKKLQTNSIEVNNKDESQEKLKVHVQMPEQKGVEENLSSRQASPESKTRKERQARVPKAPPRPTSATRPPYMEVNGSKVPPAPPPPPPPPSKMLVGLRAVRRVPEVMEFYRLLTRRDTIGSKPNSTGTLALANTRNMIGEIENRSSYLLAIKSDVETQGEFIDFLTREVENAAYKEISDVEAFVKWLDKELSYLVDERAVLKHFPKWPEQKADTLREAAFSYRDLKNLESEVLSFKDNQKLPLPQALQRMQALQERLERSINNVERTRESTCKRYKAFQIPWEWMLDTGVIGRMKLTSMRLATEHMKRISKELHSNECLQAEDLLLQGVRFAYRVHQFAGGFDEETTRSFEDLRKAGMAHQKRLNADTRAESRLVRI